MRRLLYNILKAIDRSTSIVEDNNRMLREIIGVINVYGKNADNENMQDFGRNVLANLMSNIIDWNVNFRKK